jgi:CRP-like cAMP-binding protein
VALLDRRVTALVGQVPELNTALFGRAMRRSRWLALHLAIRCLRRIDVRLLVLFWHLADRWGRVTPAGVVLPLPFTHDLLGRLVGAQRPTVTTALGQLADRGLVSRRADGSWLLGLELPEELVRLDAAAASGLARSRRSVFSGERAGAGRGR